MNLASKKTILKAYLILQRQFLCMVLSIVFVFLLMYFTQILPLKKYIQTSTFTTILIAISVYFLLYIIHFCFCLVIFRKKLVQKKEDFYKNTLTLKILSFFAIPMDLYLSPLLFVTAFCHDDGKEEGVIQQKPKKEKPKKPNFSKDQKKEIATLKSKRNRGIISKELYQKKYNQILKQTKNNQD